MNATEFLFRTKRHPNFVTPFAEHNCFSPTLAFDTDEIRCRFVTTYPPCIANVKFFNYLEILFCHLQFGNAFLEAFITIIFVIIYFFIYFLVIFMTTWHFLGPNLLSCYSTGIFNEFNFGFIPIPILMLLPELIECAFICVDEAYSRSMLLCDHLGSMMVCFVSGFVPLSFGGGRLNPLLFLAAMTYFIVNYIFIIKIIFIKSEEDYFKMFAEEPIQIDIRVFAGLSVFVYTITIFAAYGIQKSYQRQRNISSPNTVQSGQKSVASVASTIDSDFFYEANNENNSEKFNTYLYAIDPRNHLKKWKCWERVLVFPIWLILSTIIPVIHPHRKLNGWNKYTACISLIILPMCFIVLVFPEFLFHCLLFLGVIMSVLTFTLTSPHRIPNGVQYFSFVGILLCTFLYNVLDYELDTLCAQVLGYYLEFHMDAVSLTSYHISSTVGELIYNIYLVKYGYSTMVFGVTMGLLIILLHTLLPLIFLTECDQDSSYVVISANSETAITFHIVFLICIVYGYMATDFHLRLSHGILLLLLYFGFFLFIALSELELIHAFGSHHIVTELTEKVLADWA